MLLDSLPSPIYSLTKQLLLSLHQPQPLTCTSILTYSTIFIHPPYHQPHLLPPSSTPHSLSPPPSLTHPLCCHYHLSPSLTHSPYRQLHLSPLPSHHSLSHLAVICLHDGFSWQNTGRVGDKVLVKLQVPTIQFSCTLIIAEKIYL